MRNHRPPGDPAARRDPARAADRLLEDIHTIRGNLGSLIGELDQRRRRAFDVRLQARRHPVATVAAAVAVLGMLGGAIALGLSLRRRRRSPRARAHALREALERMIRDPRRVAKESPSVGRKILAAGGTAVASALGKQMIQRLAGRAG